MCGSIAPVFDLKHGKNIELGNENLVARRLSSYNYGIVVCNQILEPEQLFQVSFSLTSFHSIQYVILNGLNGNCEIQKDRCRYFTVNLLLGYSRENKYKVVLILNDWNH